MNYTTVGFYIFIHKQRETFDLTFPAESEVFVLIPRNEMMALQCLSAEGKRNLALEEILAYPVRVRGFKHEVDQTSREEAVTDA